MMESEGPRRRLCGINHRLKRNKVLVRPKGQGLWWVAVDGHELFASRSRHCPACSERKVKVGDQEVIEYYHRGVSCHLIGQEMALPLDFELVRPGEGETVAARRMLERVIRNYGRFFDGVVGDALYLDAPTFNFCLEHHKHVMAVIKKEASVLLNDARGLFAQTRPVQWEVPGGVVRCWDLENDQFNTLATHWSLDHCFKHDPVAILNFILTLFVASVLLQSFHQRNLKLPVRRKLTLIATVRPQRLAPTSPARPWTSANLAILPPARRPSLNPFSNTGSSTPPSSSPRGCGSAGIPLTPLNS